MLNLNQHQLGLGTWQWGDTFFWQYGQGYADTELREAFTATLDAGISLFDTAEVYGQGRSESLLGRCVREAKRPTFIATKFMPFPWRLSQGALHGALRKSLDRLGVERVDLYQTHWPLPPMPVETWMEAMAEAVAAKRIGAVGVSNYNVEQTRRAYERLKKHGIPLASNQVPYSLLDRRIEKNGLLALCAELGIRVIAYSPLAQGALTGKYTPDKPLPGIRGQRYRRSLLTRIQPLIETLKRIGEVHEGKTPAQVALNWCLSKGTLAIPGAKNTRQAQQNAGALGWQLTLDEMAELDRVSDSVSQN